MTLTIGIVAGEVSGDMLGANFMQQMKALRPDVRFVGVGGSAMRQAGLDSIIDMTRLSVMGLTEVIKHLPDLFIAKREILSAFEREKIDIFVGIDAPDFNLRLGKTLKPKGVFCVQMVSPSIWAWRENRIHTIKEATDLVLCLFPFELPVYAKHRHPAVCIGHPLLDKLHPDNRPNHAIKDEFIAKHSPHFASLDKLKDKTVLCMMAGSRTSEIKAILPLLIDSMAKLDGKDIAFLLPVVSQEHARLVEDMIFASNKLLLTKSHIIYPQNTQNDNLSLSQQAMNASDLVVLASGTATLETLLLHRPMVVVYRLSTLSYAIAKRLVKIPYVCLPNILSHGQTQTAIVPELIQHMATADNIAHEAKKILANPDIQKAKLAQTTEILRQESHHNSAHAVLAQFSKTHS